MTTSFQLFIDSKKRLVIGYSYMSFMITITMGNIKKTTLFLLLLISLLIGLVAGDCTCDAEEGREPGENSKALNLKIVAIFSILVFGGVGIVLPLLSKVLPACQPGTDLFFMIKAFAAGVILATGFIHVLPDAFEHLTSPCLNEHPWGDFPFTGFISMVAAIGTLMVDTIARSYFTRKHLADEKTLPMTEDQETGREHAGHVHVHTHASHGHSHGSDEASDLMRDRVISMVLELGIVVHSVIIGISLGTSQGSSTIKTLLIALSFHQFFEGMGLGGCMSQAKFKTGSLVWMALWFAFTTPIGIAIGIGISNFYNENSPTALIVEGVFNSASAGILIYMALVDLLAADFMSNKIQSNGKLQFLVNLFLLSGAGFMSLLAKWA